MSAISENDAWSVTLLAVSHRSIDRAILTTLGYSRISCSDLKPETYVAPSRPISQAEKSPSSTQTGLYVGLYVNAACHSSIATQTATKKRKASQMTDDSNAAKAEQKCVNNAVCGAEAVRYSGPVLKVIAINDDTVTKYYALINPEKGLCEAVPIPMERVFFFAEFRNDSITSMEDRKSAWNAKVHDFCVVAQAQPLGDVAITSTHVAPQTAPQTAPDIIYQNRLAHIMYTSPNIHATLECAYSMLKMHELASLEGHILPKSKEDRVLELTSIGTGSISDSNAECILQCLLEARSDFADLEFRPQELQALSGALVAARFSVPYSAAFAFIYAFVRESRSVSTRGTDPAKLAEQVYKGVSIPNRLPTDDPADPRSSRTGRYKEAMLAHIALLQNLLQFVTIVARDTPRRSSRYALSAIEVHEAVEFVRVALPSHVKTGVGLMYAWIAAELFRCSGNLDTLILAKIKMLEAHVVGLDNAMAIENRSFRDVFSSPLHTVSAVKEVALPTKANAGTEEDSTSDSDVFTEADSTSDSDVFTEADSTSDSEVFTEADSTSDSGVFTEADSTSNSEVCAEADSDSDSEASSD